MALISRRAKWRSSLSGRSRVGKKHLTELALSERPDFVNLELNPTFYGTHFHGEDSVWRWRCAYPCCVSGVSSQDASVMDLNLPKTTVYCFFVSGLTPISRST